VQPRSVVTYLVPTPPLRGRLPAALPCGRLPKEARTPSGRVVSPRASARRPSAQLAAACSSSQSFLDPAWLGQRAHGSRSNLGPPASSRPLPGPAQSGLDAGGAQPAAATPPKPNGSGLTAGVVKDFPGPGQVRSWPPGKGWRLREQTLPRGSLSFQPAGAIPNGAACAPIRCSETAPLRQPLWAGLTGG